MENFHTMFVHFDTYAPQLFDEMQLLRNKAEATTIVNDDVKQLVTQVFTPPHHRHDISYGDRHCLPADSDRAAANRVDICRKGGSCLSHTRFGAVAASALLRRCGEALD